MANAYVKYTGFADIRVLGSADLVKGGVEGFTKTEFHKGRITEVDEAVAEALVGNPDLYGEFEIAEMKKVGKAAGKDAESNKGDKLTDASGGDDDDILDDVTPTKGSSTPSKTTNGASTSSKP